MWTTLRGWWGKDSDSVGENEQERIVTAVAALLERGSTELMHESQLPAPLPRVRRAFQQEIAGARRQRNQELFDLVSAAYVFLADFSQLPADSFARAHAAHQRFMAGDPEALLDADYMRERSDQMRRTEEFAADLQALQNANS